MKEFTPVDIQVQNDQHLVAITWADGHISRLPITRLRGYCPCAECQGHQRIVRFHENRVQTISGADLVGRYAVSFRFSDNHALGIFRFDILRKLDQSEELRWGVPEESLVSGRAEHV